MAGICLLNIFLSDFTIFSGCSNSLFTIYKTGRIHIGIIRWKNRIIAFIDERTENIFLHEKLKHGL